MPRRKAYTGFGRTMQRLMAKRDIRSWVHLEELIEEATGNSYAHQSMSKYASGDRITSRELAVQYAYHSLPE